MWTRRVFRESAQMTTISPNSANTWRQAPHGLSPLLGASVLQESGLEQCYNGFRPVVRV